MFRQSLLPVATSAATALVLLSVGCLAQATTECGDKTVVTNFNATQYMGKWVEYAKFGNPISEVGGICVTEEYSMVNSNNITVVSSMKDNSTLEVNSTTGWADFTGAHTDAKLKVHGPTAPADGSYYWVLSTDYENYSVVWSCVKRPDSAVAKEISWILLRPGNNWNMTLEKVKGELTTLQLPMLNEYTKTEQSPALCAGAAHVVGAVISVVLASLFALFH